MRLRKQLLLASLFTLSLPWVGCQYIQEMERTLRQGQDDALKATANAVAATLANDDDLRGELENLVAPPGTTSIHLHPFSGPLLLDGYPEEWDYANMSGQSFSPIGATGDSKSMTLFGAEHGGKLWLFMRVPDDVIRYFNPGESIADSDHLLIAGRSASGELRRHAIVASSPGQARVITIDGETETVEHQIKASWREWESGYQVEIQLPLSWSIAGLRFQVMDDDGPPSELRYSSVASINDDDSMAAPTIHSEALSNSLKVFVREGVALKLASSGSAFIADAGNLSPIIDPSVHWLLAFIYRLALDAPPSEALPNPHQKGYFLRPEVLNALHGSAAVNHYAFNNQTVSSISVPVMHDQRALGAVVIEQSTHGLNAFTDIAFNRLLIYSIIVSALSAGILVSYATWLSVRIGRLSRSATHAISESGKINEDFRASRINDEIGDVSRSFGQLLSRLKEYTHYLKTLSSKLSHELRTPLAIVSSSLDNLEHENISKNARTYAQRAKEGSARLSNILNAMSAASRVEQAIGAAETELIPVDELLSNLKGAYEDVYPNVRFALSIQANKAGFKILGAGELLVQMMDKLVDNAADFCPDEGLIEFGLYRQQNALVITVRNEGPTLPQTMQRQLFDSMVSVRSKTKEDEDGHHLGLGLYIVRLIVDFHQGAVEAYNVPDNSGVIFEIRLPVNT